MCLPWADTQVRPYVGAGSRLAGTACRLGTAQANMTESNALLEPRRRRLLIVEDDLAEAERIREVLEEAAHPLAVDVASSVAFFDQRMERGEYDVVLTGHALRGPSGFDLLSQLTQAEKSTPLIVVTKALGDEVAIEYLRRGAADYVLKDRLETLPTVIDRVLHYRAREAKAAQLNERILAAKREWELTFDTVPDPLLVIDRDCRVMRANRAAAQVLGLQCAELVGMSFREVMGGETAPLADCPHLRLLSGGAEASGDLEMPRLGKTFHCTATPLRDNPGTVIGSVFLMHDITGRIKAAQALRESEERFRQMADNIDEVFFITGLQGKPVYYVSPAFEKLFGRSLREAYENPLGWLEAVHPEDRARIEAAVRAMGAEAGRVESNFRICRADGSIRHAWTHITPVRNDAGMVKRLVGVTRDVTGRRELELQLLQAQKMEAIGRLAGGVAHDFNNLLTIITGYAQLLLERAQAEEPQKGYIEEIDKAAGRAAQLTRQLLAFSRRQLLIPQVLDLNAVVSGMEKMMKRLIGEDIELVAACEPNLGRVRADPGQIEQVIMNLIVNARDAMPHGGQLTLETRNADLDPRFASTHAAATPGPYVVLSVRDTGCGMESETLKHIFEPFFTTKEKGRGSGLGLAVVYGIVEQSGGHIMVQSEVGRGSTFKIYLPHVLQTAETAAPASPASAGIIPLAGSETVLVVEDEDALRALVCKMLRDKGYTVLEASRGADALEISSRCAGPIHLMLTDVVMPEMDGQELAVRLAAAHPETRVLFMSGYTDDAVSSHGVAVPGTFFLQKPFKPEMLAQKVRSVLDAAPNPALGGIVENSF